MKRFVTTVLLAWSFLLGNFNEAGAITFGREVTDASTSYPSVVSIWYTDSAEEDAEFICTGTLIKPRIVLTAAHCVLSSGLYFVQYGVDRLYDELNLRPVSATWRNPRYSASQFANDTGLLLLEEEILGAEITRLPTASEIKKIQSTKGVKYEIVGWGKDQNDEAATYLRRALVDDQTKAVKKLKRWRDDIWFAVGKWNNKEKVFAGSCNGDSGGPLFAKSGSRTILAGITSWGAEDCETAVPSVYVRLSYYIDTLLNVGIPTLLTNEIKANRLPPTFSSEPTISVKKQNGYLLSCDFQTNSLNKTKITWSSAAYNFNNSSAQSVLLLPGRSVAKVTCNVTLSNPNGTITQSVDHEIPAAPQLSSYPKISSMPSANSLNGTQTLACSPATGDGFKMESNSFWVGKSSSFSAADSIKVSDGSNLVLTKSFLQSHGGKFLFCMTELVTEFNKQTEVSSASLIPEITLVRLDYSDIGFTGSYSPGSYYAPVVGDTMGCQVSSSKFTPEMQQTASTSWSVGSTSEVSLATKFSNSPLLTVTSDIRNLIRGKYIFCQVTYTNLAGTSTGYRSSTISKTLPPYSVAIEIQGVSEFIDLKVGTVVTCAYVPAKGTSIGRVSFNSLGGFNSEGSSFTVTQEILNQIVGYKLTCNVYAENEDGGGTFSASTTIRGSKVVAPVSKSAEITAPVLTNVEKPTVQICERATWTNCGTVLPGSGNHQWTLVVEYRVTGESKVSSVQTRVLMPNGSVLKSAPATLKTGTENDGSWTSTFSPVGGGPYSNGSEFKIQAKAVNSLGGESDWTLVSIYFINNFASVNSNPQ